MSSKPYAAKSFGQHFLIEKKIIEKIVTDFPPQWPSGIDLILEVGPGTGALTKDLLKHNHPYLAVEADRRMAEYLREEYPQLNLIHLDALKFNPPQDKSIWLVSNLPYNVSVPLLIKFSKLPNILKMTLMFQKEVANKVLALDNGKFKNNSLHTLMQTYFDVTLLTQVQKGHFAPPPKVDSTVLSFVRKERPLLPLEDFLVLESFLRQCFQFRRKKLTSNLKNNYSTQELQEIFQQQKISLDIRAEDLSLKEMLELFKRARRLPKE